MPGRPGLCMSPGQLSASATSICSRTAKIATAPEKNPTFSLGVVSTSTIWQTQIVPPLCCARYFPATRHSPLAEQSIDNTLKRELREELDGLRHGEHYQYERLERLPPFRKVSGAGNRHAYTEYAFTLYTLRLTPAGELHLLECEAKQNELVWFTANEIAAAKKPDGTTAFVDVLHKCWGERIAEKLAAIPEACVTGYALDDETRMIDLPASCAHPLRFGKTGKERNIELKLTEPECQLLQLLGWHALGFDVETKPGTLLLGSGWVRLGHGGRNQRGSKRSNPTC